MDPFLGEVRMMGFGFAPRGWASCNGQTIGITQNTALYAILGTIFGGDGRTTFGLPNLQGATPMGAGNGTGLTPRVPGQTGGATTVTLQQSQIPSHTHQMMCVSGRFAANTNAPAGNAFATSTSNAYAPTGNQTPMAGNTLQSIGGGGSHNNMMPYVTVNFLIALTGTFPLRP